MVTAHGACWPLLRCGLHAFKPKCWSTVDFGIAKKCLRLPFCKESGSASCNADSAAPNCENARVRYSQRLPDGASNNAVSISLIRVRTFGS